MSTSSPPALALLADALGSSGRLELPQQLFADPAVLVLELRDYFFADWIPVAHKSELPAPGARTRCSIATREFLIVRQADHSLLAFRNRCLHAGFPLVEDADPKAHPSLVCKYHNWIYDLAGTLVSAPNMPACSARLQSYPVGERGGLIYLHPSAQEAQHGPATPRMPQWLERADAPLRRSFSVDANWKTLAFSPGWLRHWELPDVGEALQPCGRLAWFAADDDVARLVRLAPADVDRTTVIVTDFARAGVDLPQARLPLEGPANSREQEGSPDEGEVRGLYADYLMRLRASA